MTTLFDFSSEHPDGAPQVPTVETPAAGLSLHRRFLDLDRQMELLEALRTVTRSAPFFVPRMRSGTPYRIEMTNAGRLGWVSDERGYRYQEKHPITGLPWPEIPKVLLQLSADVAGQAFRPDCCLVNLYRGPQARLGLHQDRDERTFDAPIISISLGDDCEFQFGGVERSAKVTSHRLRSGDVAVFGGQARLAWHGVTKVYPNTSSLLRGGGRLNITIRQVDP